MSKASRITYLEQLYNGNLENKQTEILDYIYKNGRQSTEQLRDKLIYPHQTLTASLSALMDFGLINVVDIIQTEKEGRKSTFSVYEFVYNEIEQISLQDERHLEKALKWEKNYKKYKDILKITLVKN